jgi:hypothetical protein
MGVIRVAWWNLENLFDTVDDPISRDFEFTPAAGWTPQAYQAKKQNLAAVLNELHGGQGPELLGSVRSRATRCSRNYSPRRATRTCRW